MGINGLWPVLSSVAQSTTLGELAIEEGFNKRMGVRGYCVGIDISGWIYAVCSQHNSTKNPELVTLFSRFGHLLRLPIFPLFVFDGPARPSNKRGKYVRGDEHWMTVDIKKILTAFGFRWIVAPGEAEAELARMSSLEMLDAIITQDSDAVVFGATTIIRLGNNFAKTDQVKAYHARDIIGIGLDQPALVLIAMLIGGDYAPGIEGCGMQTAQHLARAGFGKSLIAAIEGGSSLVAWRAALCNELHSSGSRQARIADAIPASFPDPHIIGLYLHPNTSNLDPLSVPVSGNGPDLASLARFAEEHFVWGDTFGILKKFSTSILPGLAVRQLVHSAAAMDLGLNGPHCPIINRIVLLRAPGAVPRIPEMRILLSIDTHVSIIRKAIEGKRDTPTKLKPIDEWLRSKHRAWVPSAIMRHVFPSLVRNFNTRSTSSKTRRTKATIHSHRFPAENVHPVISPMRVVDLTTPPPEVHQYQPPSSTERAYRVESSAGGNILEFVTDSEGDF